MARFSFGPFLLDLESRALMRYGERVTMAGRTLDTLVVLLQNRGRLLEKDELLSLIWPGTIVDEANLSQSIFTLRKALGDSSRDPRYIATIAGRGYQFIAAVTELTSGSSQMPSAHMEAAPHPAFQPALLNRRMNLRSYAVWAVVTLVLAGVALIMFLVKRPAYKSPELAERRLTFNSSANPIKSSTISPDGRYLAYSDLPGIHIRLLSTGEERLIPATAVAPAGAFAFVDDWFPNGTELLGHSEEPSGRNSMWAVSVMGQASRTLRADALGWGLSPDGTHIAFSPVIGGHPQPEIWLMDQRGEHPQRVLSLPADQFLWSARWSPDGQRLAYIRADPPGNSLETCDLKGANRTTVVLAPDSNHWVRSFWWLPEGRILYSRAEAADVEANLWQIHVDNSDGKPIGPPARMTHWVGVDVKQVSASNNGMRLALRKDAYPSQIYIGKLQPGLHRLSPPQRLTNDEAVDWATAWTADSQAVLFTSNRGEKWGVFKQGVTQDGAAEPLTQGRETAKLARLSPDGSWVLYSESSAAGPGRQREYRLMRVPVTGGSPQLVYVTTNSELQDYPCAHTPTGGCVLIEASSDSKQIIVTALDPLKSKGKLLRTIPKPIHAGFNDALSPDGATLAVTLDDSPESEIHLFSLTGGADRDIYVKDWHGFGSLEWSPDGKGLYCDSSTSRGASLLYVDLKGTAQVVSQSKETGGGTFIAAVPSPDGRYLSLTGADLNSNAWLIESF